MSIWTKIGGKGTAQATPFAPRSDIPASDTQAAIEYLRATIAALSGVYQPLDSDLTAIAALATTAYGRSLLTLANATALAAEVDSFFLTPAEGNAAYQPLDGDLTSIAALTTTTYGRSLLTLANATALAAEVDSFFLTPAEGNAAYQPLDSDLTAIAALTTTTFGRSLLTFATAALTRAALGLDTGDSPTFTGITATGAAALNSTVAWGGIISPAQLTSNTNDWAPTGLSGASVIRFSTDASRNITGLTGGAAGRLIILHNIGSFNAVLKNSVTSTAANQFLLNADVTLSTNQSLLLQYDGTSSRWRAVGGAVTFDGIAPTTTQGDIIFRNATTNTRLGAGTAGYGLQTNGTAADPTWVFKREILAAARTYYVRTDGSNSNTGLVDSAGGAFLTLQKAYDTISGTLDLAGYDVTIQVRSGTYTTQLAITGPWTGGGRVIVVGDTTTPTNVLLSTTSADAIAVSCALPGTLFIRGFEYRTTTSGSCISHSGSGTIDIDTNNKFGACAQFHITASGPGAKVRMRDNYTIGGSAACHFLANAGADIVYGNSNTVTISGTPAFSPAFAYATRCSIIEGGSITWSGAATGPRYSADMNAVILFSAVTLPGSTAGSTATGGQAA